MQRYDIAILGGGISGLGLAVEASAHGRSVVLFEAGRCCGATSDNSLRIIHGGFRYLQHLQLGRVVRSLVDQTHVIQEYSDAVVPLPCLMPLQRTGLKSRLPVTVAALLYGTFMKACRSPLPAPCVYDANTVQEIAPIIADHAPHGALCWHDAIMVAPEKITRALISKALSNGAVIHEETPVQSIIYDTSVYEVRLQGGDVVYASKVINALGPWLGTVEIPSHLQGIRPTWCKGFNITIRRQLHPTHALALQSPDGRLFFCVPRGNQTAIGTWYVPANAPDARVHNEQADPTRIAEEELGAFLSSLQATFPEAHIDREDIVGVDAGLLPMKHDSPRGPSLYGSELIHESKGYCEIVSTKYTTFRSQARAVVRRLT